MMMPTKFDFYFRRMNVCLLLACLHSMIITIKWMKCIFQALFDLLFEICRYEIEFVFCGLHWILYGSWLRCCCESTGRALQTYKHIGVHCKRYSLTIGIFVFFLLHFSMRKHAALIFKSGGKKAGIDRVNAFELAQSAAVFIITQKMIYA